MQEGHRRATQLPRLIVGATTVIIAIIWAVLTWHVLNSREAALTRTRDLASSLSRALREHAEQAFATVDTVLGAVNSQQEAGFIPGTDGDAEYRMLRTLRDSTPMLYGIGLVDTEGNVTASADTPRPAPIHLGDRPYFAHHRDDPSTSTLIGEPVLSRPGNLWVIPVSRRLNDAEGHFAGIVAARIRTDYFNRIYRAVGADSIALYRGDGVLLAQEPDDDYREGPRLAARSRPRAAIHAVNDGTIEAPPDNDRLYTYGYSTSGGDALTVVVGIDRSAVLAAWARDLAITIAGAVPLTAAAIGFAILLLERVRAQWQLTLRLDEARDAEAAAKLRAETANRAKADFLAQMSHELRTPLNAINGFSDIMVREMFGPIMNQRYREYAAIIKQSGEHLLVIINNILDTAKVEAGHWHVETVPVDIAALFSNLAVLTQERSRNCGVTVTFGNPADGGHFASDSRLLLQILLNLTTNAIKFTPSGGTVAVTVERGTDEVRFSIVDNGEGMSESDLAHIFEPYSRGSSRLGRLRHGTGLGLPLSRRFTTLLRGTLTLESTIGSGTTALVSLPIAPPQG